MTMVERTFEDGYSEPDAVKSATRKKRKRDRSKTGGESEDRVDNIGSEGVDDETFTKKSIEGLSLMESHYETIGSDSPEVVTKKKHLGQKRRRKLFRQKLREREGTKVQAVQRKRIGNLAPEHDDKVKQMYRESYKLQKSSPSIFVDESGVDASLKSYSDSKYPLIFLDIEEFIYNAQLKIGKARWACVNRARKVRNTIVLVVEGPGMDDYVSEMDDCPTLKSFRAAVQFISPLSYDNSLERCFASSLEILPPRSVANDAGADTNKASETQKGDLFTNARDNLFNIQRTQTRDEQSTGIKSNVKVAADLKGNETASSGNGLFAQTSSDDVKASQTLPVSLYKQDAFSRLDLILTPREMANERYPLPFFPMYHEFVKTKDEYEQVTEKSPMFGLDCEMCTTTAGSELTRISVVNEKHQVVYERLVKPLNRITNYATKYSGITASLLKPVTTRLSDVQRDLQALLPPNAILVGQSLNFDLMAMKMMHPYVIDTSVVYNISGVKSMKTKLKTLCEEFLSERIQCASRVGHDSIEDASASLKLIQEKLKHSIEWGNALLGYKRTEKESRDAHLLLLEKEKNRAEPRYRLALNAKVDKPYKFDPYSESLSDQELPDNGSSRGIGEVTESSHKRKRVDTDDCRESKEEKCNKRKKMDSEIIENDPSTSKKEVSLVDKKTDRDNDQTDSNDLPQICSYPQVDVVGSEEVCRSYETHLPAKYHERVHFLKVSSANNVIGRATKNNSEDNRLIIAHLSSPCVCKVEKWTKKLFDACKTNDMLCVALCGTKDLKKTVKGTFFVTFPSQQSSKPIKQSVQEYLESNGYVYNEALDQYTSVSCSKSTDTDSP